MRGRSPVLRPTWSVGVVLLSLGAPAWSRDAPRSRRRRRRPPFPAAQSAAQQGPDQPARGPAGGRGAGAIQAGRLRQGTDRALALGKALFWDMQVGSDGLHACATCHFHAGADPRREPAEPGPEHARADLTYRRRRPTRS